MALHVLIMEVTTMPTTALIMWEHERDLVKLRTVEVYMTATMTMTWILICWQNVSMK